MGDIMAEEDHQLDASVWSHLPPEILDHVLCRLPLEVLYRFRTVCKRWRALPSSAKFCNAVLHPRSRESYLLGIEQVGALQKCPVYNPAAEKWSRFDLGFLESRFERFSFERWSSYDDRWGSSECKGASSNGGLLCLSIRIHESEQDAIFVCNPLTKACNLLPLIESSTWGLCLGLAIRVENHNHYRVFATKHGKVENGNRFEQRLYMYDSAVSFWKLLPKCPRFAHDAISGVFCNGVYYALYEDVLQGHDVLMSYDVDHDAWVDVGVLMTLSGLKKLVVSGNNNNRLFCVCSAREESENDLYLSVVEVNLYTGVAAKISGGVEHVTLPEDGRFHHKKWNVIGYRNAILLLTRSQVPFVFDLTADLPEWRPLNLASFGNSRLPKLLVEFTFDLRATVD